MKAGIVRAGGTELLHAAISRLSSTSFLLFMHIITEPFVSKLCKLPRPVRETSEIFIDKERESINKYAADRLTRCGYRVYWVWGLHTKLLITTDFVLVGSANWSKRSIESNEEILFIINVKPSRIEGLPEFVKRIRGKAVLHEPG